MLANATPIYAAAGIVVTDIATPTAVVAWLVTKAVIAATPAVKATITVAPFTTVTNW